MSTAGARASALDAAVEVGPVGDGDTQLAEALAELEAAERRVAKVEQNLAVVKASLDEAQARVAELQKGE